MSRKSKRDGPLFARIGSRFSRRTLQLCLHPDEPLGRPYDIVRGIDLSGPPLGFFRTEGRVLADKLDVHDPVPLFSRAFIQVLEAAGATGWQAFPTEILVSESVTNLDYRLLVVTGRCGRLAVEPGPCGCGAHHARSVPRRGVAVHFPLSTWDGSDVFMPESTGNVLFTASVASALKEARLSNVVVEWVEPEDETELTAPDSAPRAAIQRAADAVIRKEARSGFDSLSQKERVIFCVWIADGEVGNGGLHAVCYNSTGDYLRHFPVAFRAIGATARAGIFEQLIAVFGSRGPSAQSSTRQRQHEKLSRKAAHRIDELDEAWLASDEDVEALLSGYVSAR